MLKPPSLMTQNDLNVGKTNGISELSGYIDLDLN